VQIDALAVRLRPRTGMEAADLGTRLCLHAARDVYPCYALVAVPVALIALLSHLVAWWLPTIVIWWSKPWLDRTILFVLSRAAFGQRTAPADVWDAQRQVWWSHILYSLTVRRLSFWRSLTEPVYQLEGLGVGEAGSRVGQIRRQSVGAAFLMTQAFWIAESQLYLALMSLVFWFAPAGTLPNFTQMVNGEFSAFFTFAFPISYAITVFFLEPFFVGAGFAMYLNRRVELEAWDIEQEFRRAFAA
jgi:hypothetical protein